MPSQASDFRFLSRWTLLLPLALGACANDPEPTAIRSPGGAILLAAAQSAVRSDASPTNGSCR